MLKRTLILTALIVSLLTNISWAQERRFPRINHFGFLGYDFNMTRSDSANAINHNALVNWNISSYIKQPYIGQYFAGITLRYDIGDASESDKSKRYAVLGNLELRLFPMSHFPFKVYWAEEDQRTRQEQASLVTKRRIFGLVQRYTSKNNFNSIFRVEYNQQEFDDRVAASNQFGKNFLANLDIGMPLGNWQLNWRSLYRTDENSRTDFKVDRLHSILRHVWRPGAHFSMNGFTSYRDTRKDRADGFNSQDRRAEFNNFLTWRPDTGRPLLVSSIFRHVEFLGGNSDAGGLTGGTTSINTNANYRLSDHFTLQGNAGGSVIRSEIGSDVQSSALLDGRYQSFPHRFGTFAYQWNTSLGARWAEKDDEFGGVITGIGRFGHSLDKLFPVGSSPIVIRFSQFLTLLEGSDGQSTRNLSNSLNINWNRNTTRRSTMLSAGISDNRSRGGGGRVSNQDRDLQLATLMFSQTENLSRNSRVLGSISIQIRRSAVSSQVENKMTPSGTADITYINRMLMGVPLLQYRSTLRWYSSNFNSSRDDPTQAAGTEGMFWDNRLDYALGRLDFRLLLRISNVNDIGRSTLYFSVRRNFGGFLN